MLTKSLSDLPQRDEAYGSAQDMLTPNDGSPFSWRQLLLEQDGSLSLDLPDHFAAHYCLEGSGVLESKDGRSQKIERDMTFALSPNSPWSLRAATRMQVAQILTPRPETSSFELVEDGHLVVRDRTEVEGTERDVAWGNGQSLRILVQSDGMPTGLTRTTVSKGTSSFLQYRHYEACLWVSGGGKLSYDDPERSVRLEPGVLYCPERSAHYLIADIDSDNVVIICAFNPPLVGGEVHDLSREGVASSYVINT